MKYALAFALLILPLYWLILQLVTLYAKAAAPSQQGQPSDTPTSYDLY